MKTLKQKLSAVVLAMLGAAALESQARAEPVIQVRCADDSLDPTAARNRLEWARACGVPNHVDSFDTGLPSANGAGNLFEYIETFDFWGKNAYTGVSNGNQINYQFVTSQYYNGPTNQFTVNTFKKWTRVNLLPRPTYPIFGNNPDLNFATPLYPHPTLADCRLYTDKNGAQPINPATTSFYVNAYCVSSCYTPEQEVLFPNGYEKIADAMTAMRPDMMTLSSTSTIDKVSLVSNEVYSYTRERIDGWHVIYEIKTASGGELRVTDKHPVIDGKGKVVEARSLKVGDALVKPDGKFDTIVSVEKTKYYGKVYNIRPVTRNRVSNILVAQGFLVGSSAYQNEDVDYMNRVILGRGIPRDVIPQ